MTPLEALDILLKHIECEVTTEDYLAVRNAHIIVEKSLKALEIINERFDFDFALRFPNNQPMLRIEKKRTNEYWELPIPKKEFDLLKEVLK